MAGVAGRYVASTGPLLEVTGSQSSLFPQQGLGPIELYGVITTLCDIEVGGDGQSPDANLDETFVDSTAGGGGAGSVTGGVPNSLWDDGGVAGACHTSTYGYDNAAHTLYNTPGCPTGNYAMAEDMLLGDSVEIGVGCDNTSTAPGNTGGPDVVGASSCVANEVILQQDPNSLTGCLLPALGCILNAGTCTDPTTLICGSDGTTDSINFGEGGGHANPYTDSGPYNEDGVPYPAPANGCSNISGNAQVYAIAGVRVEAPNPADLTSGADGVGISLSLPTTGWIDQVTAGAAGVPTPVSSPEVDGDEVTGVVLTASAVAADTAATVSDQVAYANDLAGTVPGDAAAFADCTLRTPAGCPLRLLKCGPSRVTIRGVSEEDPLEAQYVGPVTITLTLGAGRSLAPSTVAKYGSDVYDSDDYPNIGHNGYFIQGPVTAGNTVHWTTYGYDFNWVRTFQYDLHTTCGWSGDPEGGAYPFVGAYTQEN
jgi:hypothetical protein